MEQHYEGPLGKFDYDNELWRFSCEGDSLRWVGGNRGCRIPKGIISCKSMFSNCVLDSGFYLEDVSLYDVIDMSSMFERAVIKDKCIFSAGSLYACNVKSMHSMFEGAVIYSDFDLAKADFYTGCVTDMSCMFKDCIFKSTFSLGNRFITSSVKDMHEMFMNCKMPMRFSLGENFSTCHVVNFSHMFDSCQFPQGFKLDERFTIESAEDVSYMFCGAVAPKSFCIESLLDASLVENRRSMFADFKYGYDEENCYSPEVAANMLHKERSDIISVPIEELKACKDRVDIEKLVNKYTT